MNRDQNSNFTDRLCAVCQSVLPVGAWGLHQVVVAVSGGADSVALLRILGRLRQEHLMPSPSDGAVKRLHVVHVNHSTRDESAVADAQFVAALAQSMDAEFHLRTVEWDASGEAASPTTGQSERSSSHATTAPTRSMTSPKALGSALRSENELRDHRYQHVFQVAQEVGARYVFTGHHQDDQVETILFRIFRGTGLLGVSGIPTIRVVDETVSLVRPFLKIDRAAILAALSELNQVFCHDLSNYNEAYSRNFLRNRLLPELREYFGDHVDQSILRLGQHAADAVVLETRLVDQFLESVNWSGVAGPIELPMDCLKELSPILVRATLIRLWKHNGWPTSGMTFEHWRQINQAIRSWEEAAKSIPIIRNLPGNIRLEIGARTLKLDVQR